MWSRAQATERSEFWANDSSAWHSVLLGRVPDAGLWLSCCRATDRDKQPDGKVRTADQSAAHPQPRPPLHLLDTPIVSQTKEPSSIYIAQQLAYALRPATLKPPHRAKLSPRAATVTLGREAEQTGDETRFRFSAAFSH